MELTCHGGVQCLILFDADLPGEWLLAAQGKLGTITPGHSALSARGPAVVQLAVHYPDIGKIIDTVGEGIRGKFIVLPNVSQGGNHTVLSSGKHADFKRMPYVGGYVDHGQSIATLLAANRQRLSGSDAVWGSRHIYPLPTSDSRNLDYSTLGDNSCWIDAARKTPVKSAPKKPPRNNDPELRQVVAAVGGHVR